MWPFLQSFALTEKTVHLGVFIVLGMIFSAMPQTRSVQWMSFGGFQWVLCLPAQYSGATPRASGRDACGKRRVNQWARRSRATVGVIAETQRYAFNVHNGGCTSRAFWQNSFCRSVQCTFLQRVRFYAWVENSSATYGLVNSTNCGANWWGLFF